MSNNEDKVIEELTNSKELNDIIDTNTLEVIAGVVQETDNDKLKDLTYLFNQNIVKKNMIRSLKLNGLMDKLSDKVIEKLETDEITDKNLVGYLNAIQKALDSSTKITSTIPETPPIVNNTQNNITVVNSGEQLSRESREKVLDMVEKLIKASNQNNEGGEFR